MKFIIADPTEKQHLPDDFVEHCQFLAGVETLTGADFIITPSPVPVNENTLRIHINKGIGVQRKTVSDFLASFQEGDMRLWRQLIRMLHTWRAEEGKMAWLVMTGYVGQHTEYENGIAKHKVRADERKSGVYYKSFAGALTSWQTHGGYFQPIPGDNLLLEWCESMLSRLKLRDKNGGVWGRTYIPRQPIKPIEILSAVETTLLTFPGVGMERVKAIFDETVKFIPNPTLIHCIRIVKEHKIDGIGKDTRSKILKYVGWTNGD